MHGDVPAAAGIAAAQALQPRSSELRVVVVTKALGELLIERARHPRSAGSLGKARSPVERRRNFRRIGVKCNLIFEALSRFFGPGLPEAQPSRFPMRVRGTNATGKALLQL